jgi:hypothetical protein
MAKIDDLVQRRAKQVVLTIIAMHIGFLAKSITFSGQIMVSDQLLPISSRTTSHCVAL